MNTKNLEKLDRESRLAYLRRIDEDAKRIRQSLGVSAPGEIFYAPYCSDEAVIVTADGYGGATLSIVEGDNPEDRFEHHSRKFATEEEACEIAGRLDDNNDEDHLTDEEIEALWENEFGGA